MSNDYKNHIPPERGGVSCSGARNEIETSDLLKSLKFNLKLQYCSVWIMLFVIGLLIYERYYS